MTDKQLLDRNVWVLAVENYCKRNKITPFDLMAFHKDFKPDLDKILDAAK